MYQSVHVSHKSSTSNANKIAENGGKSGIRYGNRARCCTGTGQVAMQIRQNEQRNDNYLEKARPRGKELGIVSPAQLMVSNLDSVSVSR